jgi:hypothetical protein
MRRGAVVAVAALALWGCEKAETKSLVERLYEHRVKRCESLLSDKTKCDPPPGATYREGANHLHHVMVEQITGMLPARARCVMHGYAFLLCQEDPPAAGQAPRSARLVTLAGVR